MTKVIDKVEGSKLWGAVAIGGALFAGYGIFLVAKEYLEGRNAAQNKEIANANLEAVKEEVSSCCGSTSSNASGRAGRGQCTPDFPHYNEGTGYCESSKPSSGGATTSVGRAGGSVGSSMGVSSRGATASIARSSGRAGRGQCTPDFPHYNEGTGYCERSKPSGGGGATTSVGRSSGGSVGRSRGGSFGGSTNFRSSRNVARRNFGVSAGSVGGVSRSGNLWG